MKCKHCGREIRLFTEEDLNKSPSGLRNIFRENIGEWMHSESSLFNCASSLESGPKLGGPYAEAVES